MYGLGDTGPDQLTPDQVLQLQGGQYIPPPIGASIDFSASTVAQNVAGGVPLNVDVASILGTSGSTANTALWIGGGVLFLSALLFMGKGKRRR